MSFVRAAITILSPLKVFNEHCKDHLERTSSSLSFPRPKLVSFGCDLNANDFLNLAGYLKSQTSIWLSLGFVVYMDFNFFFLVGGKNLHFHVTHPKIKTVVRLSRWQPKRFVANPKHLATFQIHTRNIERCSVIRQEKTNGIFLWESAAFGSFIDCMQVGKIDEHILQPH